MVEGRKALPMAFLVLLAGVGMVIAASSSPVAEFNINSTSLDFGWNYQGILNLSLGTGYNYTNITVPNDTLSAA